MSAFRAPVLVLIFLALAGGGAKGWLEYHRRDRDFDRAAAKYRAVRAAYLAIIETQRTLLGEAPCGLDDEDEAASPRVRPEWVVSS